MQNSEIFLDYFVRIEMILKEMLKTNAYSFVKMVHMASKRDATINRYQNDLLELAQLRNAIVHNRTSDQKAIAEPHDEIVVLITKIVNQLEKPPKVANLKLQKVFTIQDNFFLDELSMIQEKYNYSVVPVYHDGTYLGCVHARLYQKAFQFKGESVKTAYDLLKLGNYQDRLVFVSQEKKLIDLFTEFNQSYEKGQGIIAYLVTETGKKNERIQGIITPADMPGIIKHLEY